MALDGLVVRAVVRELQACAGGRINKIHQPSDTDIVMQIRAQGANYRLLLSAHPTYPRMHLTEQSFLNPMEAPMFCMLMRKHCEGGILEAVEQVGTERIIKLQVKQRDELGDISVKTVIVELMGRHSNIILTDPATGTILDGIRHVTPAVSSYRLVLPGSAYIVPPDQGKQDPMEAERESFNRTLEAAGENPPATAEEWGRHIVDSYEGMSPLSAREIVHRAAFTQSLSAAASGEPPRLAVEAVWQSFDSVMQKLLRHEYEPNIVEASGSGKAYFSVIRLTHVKGDTVAYDSVSVCLEAYFGDKAERDTVKQRASDLHRFLQNEIAKNKKKLDKLEETLEEAKDADRYRIVGELLTASMHLMKKGDKSVEVVDYYDENGRTIQVELDPLLTPSENAQRYFKKYTKAKNSLAVVAEQMQEAREEIRYLEEVRQQLQDSALADIVEIREELAEQGYIRIRGKKAGGKKKKNDKPALTGFISSEGIPILVGKNNTQNEYLTCRLAQPNETWLHTKDIPGSHVVIRSADFGETTLHEAAMLAAYFSQGKSSSQVPVDYTMIRNVRKPNGAKPGYVIYDRQKTLFATPDEEAVKRLKADRK